MRVGNKANLKVQRKNSNTSHWKKKSKHQRKSKMGCTAKAQWGNKRQNPNLTLNEFGKRNYFDQTSSNEDKKDVSCAIKSEKEEPLKYQGNCNYSFIKTSEKINSSQVKDESEKKRKRKCKDEGLEQNESPSLIEVPAKKNRFYKENSNEREGQSPVSAADPETTPSVKYQENSDYSFNEYQGNEPVEIISEGLHILSETENGESRILYKSDFFPNDEAFSLLHKLSKSTNWNQKNNIIRGRKIPQPRLVAWYGPFPYTYSGSTLEPAEMPCCIRNIKKKIEAFLKEHNINVSFNAVLLNCYRNGKDSVGWHCDDELTMGVCPTIASVSLGTTRQFDMRKKLQYLDGGGKPNKCFVNLTNGSLLIMDGCMQEVWQHRIPKQSHCKYVRINLTFRTVYPLDKISRQVITKGSKQQSKYNNNDSFSKCKNNVNIYGDDDNPKFENPDSIIRTPNRLDCFDGNSSHQNLILNCNGENVKHDIAYKKVLDCNEVTDKNGNYTSLYDTDDHKDHLKTIGLCDADLSANNSHTIGIKKESTTGQELSVSSEEFVSHSSVPSEIVNFDSYSLQELTQYPFKMLDGVNLKNYAYSLKRTVKAEVIKHFKGEEHFKFLKFLLLLTDGSHTDRNQRRICKEMCHLVKNIDIKF